MHDRNVFRVTMSAVLVLLTFLVFTSCTLKSPDVLDLVPACPASSEGLFTVLPLRPQDFTALVPLGNLNPPGHTFPTDHHYFYLTDYMQPAAVYAPGHIWIDSISRSEHVTAGFSDYAVSFYACQDVHGLFGHLGTLSDSLMEAAGNFSEAVCDEYSTGGETYRNCKVDVVVELSAGDLVGTAGGGNPGQYALDFNLYDNRVTHAFANQSRFEEYYYAHAVAAIPYFDAANQDSLTSVTGSWDGTTLRTVEPIGGTIEQDIPGTAQGIWIRQGGTVYPEDPNLALVHDNIDPLIPLFSIGTSLPNFGPGVYSFVPSSSGSTNRDFGDVVPGTTIHVYENLSFSGGTVLLVRLVDANILWLEAQQATDGPPWNLTSAKVVFER